MSVSSGRPPRGRVLNCERLEDRAVPAYTLTIDGDVPTAKVDSDFDSVTTTFTANDNGATLDPADIAAALLVGNVIITTGTTVNEAGDINWTRTGLVDDLTYFGGATRTLTIRPDASATSGNVNLNGALLNFSDNMDLVIDTTATPTDGAIALLSDTQINNAKSATLNAGTNAIQLDSSSPASMTNSGNLQITADTFRSVAPGFSLRSDSGNVTIQAAIAVDGQMELRADLGDVSVTGDVDSAGGNDLSLYAVSSSIAGDVGAFSALGSLTVAAGSLAFAGDIHATTVNVGDGSFDRRAILTGPGTIDADVVVKSDGALAPSAAGGTGVMNIASLMFNGGTYSLKLGATPDKIIVGNDVTIIGGTLGDASSTGMLPGPGDFQVIDVGGSVTGQFDNAPFGDPLIVGSDAIRVTHYSGAGVGLTIAQATATPTATGSDLDGTPFKVKLTGPGQLVAFQGPSGDFTLLTRDTTLKSRIAVSATGVGADDLVNIGPVTINGDLGMLTAPNGLLVDGLSVNPTQTTTGSIKSASFFEVISDISTPGVISSLAVGRDCFTAIEAASIGKLKVARTLGRSSSWTIAGGIGSITAAEITDLTINTSFAGSIAVNGDKKQHLAGNIESLQLHLTGTDATPKAHGLKSLAAKGTVSNSLFDVQAGNVGSVSGGRFIDSYLYLDYTPGLSFDTDGTFNSGPQVHRVIEKFSTTAKTIGDENNPLNWSFVGSQIAADTIGRVKLFGLKTDNGGTPFGIKFRATVDMVHVRSSDSAAIPPHAMLMPSVSALDNDFFYIKV